MRSAVRPPAALSLAIALALAACAPDREPEDAAPDPQPAPEQPAEPEAPVDPPSDQDAGPEEPPEPEPAVPAGFDRNPDAEVQTYEPGLDVGGFFRDTSTLYGDIRATDRHAFAGDQSMVITVSSPDGYAYSRVQQVVNWTEGDEVWYGAAVYLEPGFNDAQGQGSVDIIRWDNWEEYPDGPDQGGLAVRSDGRLVLIAEQRYAGSWTELLGPYDLPEGTWVWLEVRQRFSNEEGEARNEVWMDGRLLGSSNAPNYFGHPITRHRVGVVGTPNPQPGELRMYVDHVAISSGAPILRAAS